MQAVARVPTETLAQQGGGNMEKALKKTGEQLPEEYKGENGVPLGTENIKGEDLVLPRIKIIQPTSQDSEDGLGMLKNSVTGEISDKVSFVAITFRKGWLCFDPDETHSAPTSRCFNEPNPIDKSDAAMCWKAKNWWEARQEYPNCSDVYEFSILLQDNTLAALSLKGTGVIEAKKFITAIKFRGTPFFFYTVELTTEKAKGEKGVYYVPKLNIVGDTSEELRQHGLELYNMLIERQVEVDYEPGNGSD